MQQKCGKFMADWRDAEGRRHRKAFDTAADATAHSERMRGNINPKQRPALRGRHLRCCRCVRCELAARLRHGFMAERAVVGLSSGGLSWLISMAVNTLALRLTLYVHF
jgi:hypothetical protein